MDHAGPRPRYPTHPANHPGRTPSARASRSTVPSRASDLPASSAWIACAETPEAAARSRRLYASPPGACARWRACRSRSPIDRPPDGVCSSTGRVFAGLPDRGVAMAIRVAIWRGLRKWAGRIRAFTTVGGVDFRNFYLRGNWEVRIVYLSGRRDGPAGEKEPR
mgnify:CR=1 FL=1